MKRAFTLIELLVVIAIIALLAAILFPVFSRARENARRSSCLSNVKQISISWLMYAEDYDNRLAPYSGSTLMYNVYPYVKNPQIFRCPSSTLRTREFDPETSPYGTDYGMAAANTAGRFAAMSQAAGAAVLSNVPDPSRICMLGEVVKIGGTYDKVTGFDRFRATDITNTGAGGILVSDRHLEGANYAFMDGHAKWIKEDVAFIPNATNNAIKFYWQ